MKPAYVMLGWAGLNAVLMLVMLVYGENVLFIGMYALAATTTALAACIVWLAHRARRTGLPIRMPVNSLSAGFLGVAAILAGASVVFGQWLTGIAVYFLLAAVLHVRRERLPVQARPGPTAVPTDPAVHEQRGALPAATKAATAAGFVARAVGSLRRSRKGGRR
ncbi:hypothetical protein [Qaidamihabitans albus]|uniref:hypothetical protein n=1 Tax=Qaidamihabitans albus TaxID=2795733 RepID=UPI0018F13B10|nr:hypothetical protein [Qaidamihabitans albus]